MKNIFGTLSVMFIVLLVLRLVGIITCSWWVVTAPLWALPASLLVCLLSIVCAIILVCFVILFVLCVWKLFTAE